MRTITVAASLTAATTKPFPLLPHFVSLLEVRGQAGAPGPTQDDLDPSRLRRRFDGTLLYVLRSHGADRRERLLAAAAAGWDLIELEIDDLVPELLAAIPADRRVLAWYGPAAGIAPLRVRWRQLAEHEARFYRLVPTARTHGDALDPLRLLHELGRRDVVAYAEGETALWTRVVAPQLGAPVVFGSTDDATLDCGVPSVWQLASDYGFPSVTPADELFAIAGDPVYRSLSPRLHNAAFRALDRRALYVPFHVRRFEPFWRELVASGALDGLGLPLNAICVVSPHKEIALCAAKARTPVVERARSSNFFIRNADGWTADTTDPEGVIVTLRERGVDVRSQSVAVVGCGGSGRAVAAAFHAAGADVTLVNRGFERGSLAVNLLHLPFQPLAGFSAGRYSIVVNATPVGRDGVATPFALEHLRDDAVVVDLVYGQQPTLLVASRRAAGRLAIDGTEVLLTQVRAQFRLMTGEEMPEGFDAELCTTSSQLVRTV
jgi:3-dehydroquinate dehydratase/shikimate dehydrogenase